MVLGQQNVGHRFGQNVRASSVPVQHLAEDYFQWCVDTGALIKKHTHSITIVINKPQAVHDLLIRIPHILIDLESHRNHYRHPLHRLQILKRIDKRHLLRERKLLQQQSGEENAR